MSAPVDVLKAMRVAEAYCYDAGASNAAKNMKAARDAVAELIEADKEYDAIRQRAERYPCPGMDEHVMAVRKRRAAALSRVQGVNP